MWAELVTERYAILIESEEFLLKYEPIDLESDPWFRSIKDENRDFYDKCIIMQKWIVSGKFDRQDIKNYTIILKWYIDSSDIGEYDFWLFVRNKLFTVRKEWADSTFLWKALKSISWKNTNLDALIKIWEEDVGQKGNGAMLSDAGVEKIKVYIKESFSNGDVKNYLSKLSEESDNIFLAKLHIFLGKYTTLIKRDFFKSGVREVLAV